MGMGHRVYRTGDPRAKHLKKMSEELTKLHGQEELYEMSVEIEEYIKEHKGLPANVDFYSASVYHSLGIDHDLFTPIFAVSRMRSEEHTSELQSRGHLVCRLLLEKK